MIRHLFKLIWNRKRANALVIAEIFVCFLVLFAVTTLTLYTARNYLRPIGFAYDRVFKIDVGFGGREEETSAGKEPSVANPMEARQRSILSVLKADSAVEEAAWADPVPFSQSNWVRSFHRGSREIRYSMANVTDEFRAVMGIEITRGRWFSAEDDAGGYQAMVISAALAEQAFGAADPTGQSLNGDRKASDEPEPERRVVGVMRAFRQEGEFDTQDIYGLQRLVYNSKTMSRAGSLVAKMKPGADATVEARLAASLLAAAPDWSFKVAPMELSADFTHRLHLAPVALLGVVALFLVLMVALGLSGVLWQSVTTRIREIGVRRALGASAADVKWQVIGELMVMATVAILGGIMVVLQFPFLDLLGPIPKSVFFGGLSLTIVSLYALALVCGLHPARLATTVHPAEALRYE